MAQSTSNLVNNGLVPPKAPSGLFSSNLLPQNNQTNSGMVTLPQSMGGQSLPPATLTTGGVPSYPTPSNQNASYSTPQTPPAQGGSIDYTLHPGETVDQYNSRIAAARAARDAQGGQGGVQGGPQGGSTGGALPGLVAPPQYTPQPNPGSYNTNPFTASAPTYPGLVGSLAGTAAGPTQQYIDAQNQYLEANRSLAQLRADAAQQNANIGGSRTNLAEAGGEQGLLQNLVAGKEAALTGEMSAAQAAAQVASGQQGVQQSGLYGAAGLAAPQTANILGTYNPVTGQYSGYGGGQGGGIGAGAQALGTLSLGQNFYGTQVPAFNQAKSVLGSEGGNGQTGSGLLGFLKDNPDVNPFALKAGNFVDQWLSGQFSSPKYYQLGQYLTELLTTLTPIVGAAGVSNYKQQLVQSMVDPNSGSIKEQIQNLMNIANGKMDATLKTINGQENYTGGNNYGPGNAQTAPQQIGGQGGVTLGSTQFYQKPDGTWAYK